MMLEFIDCPSCGKRIRHNATRCHKCGVQVSQVNPSIFPPKLSSAERQSKNNAHEEPGEEGSPDQAAVYGGYDEPADDFDYEEFLQEEFGKPRKKRNFWYYVGWVVIASLAFPIVLQVVKLLVG